MVMTAAKRVTMTPTVAPPTSRPLTQTSSPGGTPPSPPVRKSQVPPRLTQTLSRKQSQTVTLNQEIPRRIPVRDTTVTETFLVRPSLSTSLAQLPHVAQAQSLDRGCPLLNQEMKVTRTKLPRPRRRRRMRR